ncbi:hypothetical protein NEUTE1DRAFT_77947 [Neurospora tetrasperma FGSC 2508]|uniref:Oxidoreductase acuF-like C2H2 type zinc-finger domain-containing protein n=1 Tax=Neurospora tetrasperma (strain FGSC 2508 / ATCC MYA-4615 / P0657) TaxID=510951 RepID=F8MG37_NEUT8|nr:uncharacterized protein NEUTE1DRAFT_77947 [Neurospora tetrasperma FGSC 2508]EGO58565.1 hypothetical protein NEUTE1DRAFT_77947 [Neurospora tetrasperma FGSC 2508]EGZ72633.1 hypothetical protein NEUTE2DRAFT_156366 [Neurospora tetrasperma FGSC 2509]
MNNVTISDRCRNIRQQLTDLLAVLENGSIFAQGSTTVTPSSVKEVLERFMLWAGNLGVLRKSTSKLSLDSRLAGSSDLRDYICAELEDMSEELEDRDGTDRFHRASRDSTNAFLDRFDIDYVRHKHPKLGDGAQSSRMGRAIAKRRQFIRYCRDHKDNLAAEEEEDKAGSQKATTDKQSSKATTFVAKENLMDILQGSADILGEEDAVSLCSVSTTSESLAVLKLPRLADLSPEDDPFECPICYTLQQFRSEQAWRRHAYRDLKAYICTVGGTECDDKFFEDRTSWFDHELEQHRCNYMCVLCGVNDGKAKTTRSKLRQHILSTHGDFEADQLERLEDAGRETITSFKTNDCPFCDDWSKLMANRKPPGREAQLEDGFLVSMSRFKKHVAMHSEQLAIFALPRHEHETGIDEDASHGSDSRVIESRSSASGAASSRSGDDLGIEDHQSDQMTPTDEVSVIRAIQSRLKSQAWPTTGWQATHIQLLERVHKTSALYGVRALPSQRA